MSDFLKETENINAKLGVQIIENRLEIQTLKELLLKKGVITENEFKTEYKLVRDKMFDDYASELLGLSVEEFKKIIKENS